MKSTQVPLPQRAQVFVARGVHAMPSVGRLQARWTGRLTPVHSPATHSLSTMLCVWVPLSSHSPLNRSHGPKGLAMLGPHLTPSSVFPATTQVAGSVTQFSVPVRHGSAG